MIDISIQLPDEIFDSFRCNPQEFVKKMKLAAAIHWYQKGEISEKKAAQVAGLNHRDFLMSLAEEKVSVSTISLDQVRENLSNQRKEFIRSLRGKYKNCLSSSDFFMQQKQIEIDWEQRNK